MVRRFDEYDEQRTTNSNCVVSSPGGIVVDSMTVLLAAVSEDGEPVIVADSRVHEDPSYVALKTLRVNDSCAVGCSESSAWGGSILAALFNRREWEFNFDDPGCDVFWRIEKEGVERGDLTCAGVVEEITSILGKYGALASRHGGQIKVNFALIGKQDGIPYVAVWERTAIGWSQEVTRGAIATMKTFSPGSILGTDAAMRNTAKSFYSRIDAVCALYADAFPAKVDRNIWIRRPANCYRKEALASLVVDRE